VTTLRFMRGSFLPEGLLKPAGIIITGGAPTWPYNDRSTVQRSLIAGMSSVHEHPKALAMTATRAAGDVPGSVES
jgi:hypothetical protein